MLIKKGLSFGTYRLLDCIGVNMVSGVFASVCHCEVDRSALGEQSLFRYEQDDDLLIILKSVALR